MKGSLMLSLESTSSRMGNLARQWLNFGRFFTLDELIEGIEAVTAEEVQETAASPLHLREASASPCWAASTISTSLATDLEC